MVLNKRGKGVQKVWGGGKFFENLINGGGSKHSAKKARSWIARNFFLQLQNEEMTVWEKFLSEFQKVSFKW